MTVTSGDQPTIRHQLVVLADLYLMLFWMAGYRLRERLSRRDRLLPMAGVKAPTDAGFRCVGGGPPVDMVKSGS